MVQQQRRERGSNLIEFALIAPVLLLIILGILDFGRAIYAYSVVANAAREGARYGIIHHDPSDIYDIQCRARDTAVALNPEQLTVFVILPTEEQSTVQVEVTYLFRLITPLVAEAVGGSSVTLRSTATMYTGF